MLKVHGVHGSPFVRKVLIALELKGLDYEMVAQMPFTGDEEYKKLNPLGRSLPWWMAISHWVTQK